MELAYNLDLYGLRPTPQVPEVQKFASTLMLKFTARSFGSYRLWHLGNQPWKVGRLDLGGGSLPRLEPWRIT